MRIARALSGAIWLVTIGAPMVAPSAAEAGSLFGIVLAEPSGAGTPTADTAAPVPEAQVQVCPAATGTGQVNFAACMSTITGSDGYFSIPNVPAGNYAVITNSSTGTPLVGSVTKLNDLDLGISLQTQ